MKHNYGHLFLFAFSVLLACQPQSGGNVPGFDQEAQKAKVVAQISELSCQDTHDFITKWGGKLLPLVGDFVVEKIIKPNGEATSATA
ncbi:MAG: hypothetical protein HC913_03050 [Microscillaceae bacterium]|nr:hypothetical protein [Microscillaceae bacterium]